MDPPPAVIALAPAAFKEMENRKQKTGNRKLVNSPGFTFPVFRFLFSIRSLAWMKPPVPPPYQGGGQGEV